MQGDIDLLLDDAFHKMMAALGLVYYFAATFMLTLFVINIIIAIMAGAYSDIFSHAELQYCMLRASLTLDTLQWWIQMTLKLKITKTVNVNTCR